MPRFNLHAVAVRAVGAINPNLPVTIRVSTGEYEVTADRTRVPVYEDVEGLTAQIQPLSTGDLQHLEGMNLQGASRAIYLFGKYDAVNRIAQKGGDLVIYPDGSEYPFGTVWKIVEVIEQWPDWCKVAVSQQMDGAQ